MALRDTTPLLLHNSKCSKSRAAKALLEERGITYRERRYLEEPLSRAELEELADLLDQPPSRWTRVKESGYSELGLTPESGEEAHFAALEARPKLLERPILIVGNRAAIGRPTENLAPLLEP